MMINPRGSRKHILELLDRPDYTLALNAILADTTVELQPSDKRQPHGHADPKEWTIRDFVREHLGGSGFNCSKFDHWWVPEQFTNPTWDLLSTCTIAGRRGLLLVEAKANVSEVGFNGKSLHEDASDQSRSNHRQIIASLHSRSTRKFEPVKYPAFPYAKATTNYVIVSLPRGRSPPVDFLWFYSIWDLLVIRVSQTLTCPLQTMPIGRQP